MTSRPNYLGYGRASPDRPLPRNLRPARLGGGSGPSRTRHKRSKSESLAVSGRATEPLKGKPVQNTSQARATVHHRQSRRCSHRYPRCPITGKIRLGERKDARLVLEYVRRCAQADVARGVVSRRRECRSYRCPHCRGWHLTSQEDGHLGR